MVINTSIGKSLNEPNEGVFQSDFEKGPKEDVQANRCINLGTMSDLSKPDKILQGSNKKRSQKQLLLGSETLKAEGYASQNRNKSLRCAGKLRGRAHLENLDVLRIQPLGKNQSNGINLFKAQGICSIAGVRFASQALTTASHLVMKRAIAELTMKHPSSTHVASLVGTYGCLYFCGATVQGLSEIFESQWGQNAYRSFSDSTIKLNNGRIDLWPDAARRNELSAMLGSNGQGVIAGACKQMGQLISLTIGFVMAAGTLSLMLDPIIGITAIGSAIITGLFIYVTQPSFNRRRQELRDSSIRLFELNGQAVENIILPNKHNFGVWNRLFSACLLQKNENEASQATFDAIRNIVISFFIVAPMVAILSYTALRSADDSKRAIENVFPVFDLIRHLESGVGSIMSYRDTMADLAYLSDVTSGAISEIWTQNLQNTVRNSSKFTISHNGKLVPFNQIRWNPSRLLTPGRWTVRAKNGSGKSTLLMALAMSLSPKQNLYLLPASSQVATENGCQGSTGEVKMKQFEDIEQNVIKSIALIMLDEWNANLTIENICHMNQMIDRWSKRCSVIEVLNHDL